MSRLLLLVLLLWPSGVFAQTIAGLWHFQGPTGLVELTLQQDGAAVSGTMVGADGTRFTVQGIIEDGRATGRLQLPGGGGWFAAGLVGDGLRMVVAELDPLTGQPNLASGWELDFRRAATDGATPPGTTAGGAGAGAGDQARAPPGAPGAAQTATVGVPPQSEATALLREWLGHLRGRRLSFRESSNSNDARGFGGYSNRWDAFLCSDGTFYFQERSRVSIDVGGAMGSSGSNNETRGIWRIVEANGQAVLQYRLEGTEGDYDVLRFQNGSTYLGSNRIFVTDENPYCR
jgi:hypothetical protein